MTSILVSKLDGDLVKTKIEQETCDTGFEEKVGLDFKKVLQKGYCTKTELKRKDIIRTYSKEILSKAHLNSVRFF